MFKPTRSSLPEQPGVYIYKDKFNNIIYVGKAKNLKNRISSYFSSDHKNSVKTQILVKNIANLEYIIVDSEVEALLLENKLIKKHKPKYNIDLKDNKTYAYIKITDEKIPKIISTRKITKKGDYFGPYTDSKSRWEIINLIVSLFGIVTPKTFSQKSTLYYEIGISPAKTEKNINIEEYHKKVQEAKNFLKGKNINKIKTRLKEEMNTASKELKYEIAMQKKQQLDSIEHMLEKQKVDLLKNYDQDIAVIINDKKTQKSLIQILHISKGIISSKKDYKLEYEENLLLNFIKMFYSSNYVPKEIIVNTKVWEDENDKEKIEEYLSKLRGTKTEIILPQKGEKLSLVKLAEKNAKNSFENSNTSKLKKLLKLKNDPNIIECFDMSNLGKEYLVGAMTRFKNEKEDKEGYRKFEIKSFKGKNDDYKAMQEVIKRRYSRLKEENLEFPDLIIIDGGKGQLNAANKSLKELGLKLNTISIAKGEKRDKNEIYTSPKTPPIILDNNSEIMLYLRKIRDSVHNFVINYNRKKRDMKLREEMKE